MHIIYCLVSTRIRRNALNSAALVTSDADLNFPFIFKLYHAAALGGHNTFWYAYSSAELWLLLTKRPPTVLVTGMFAAAGTLLNVSQRAQNQGKVSRITPCPPYPPFVS